MLPNQTVSDPLVLGGRLRVIIANWSMQARRYVPPRDQPSRTIAGGGTIISAAKVTRSEVEAALSRRHHRGAAPRPPPDTNRGSSGIAYLT